MVAVLRRRLDLSCRPSLGEAHSGGGPSTAAATLRAVAACVNGASALEAQSLDLALRNQMASVTTSPRELHTVCAGPLIS